MLKIILTWWLIGLVVSLAILFKDISKDLEKDGVLFVFFEFIILGFTAPIYVIRGIIEGIKNIFKNEES